MRKSKPTRKLATQSLGGWVSVAPIRDWTDGSEVYVLAYRSKSGELWWQSAHIADRQNADVAAATLGDFLGARVLF
ncbi:hypothetical protein [Bradyrhizobium sp. 6(2017)]|uniref:hypothetical protein n=1 Tax=Bradyrhizobium sp. 6(2017) TaxID=1197460 RepID=UPI0013E118AA|nr:hypothetical protein [Bradyrhizobium sp. 6(2017)]QIG92874.1 hypothetical protein G6P99_10385 [Bradyrhizobium sp. 6(2017)]